MIVIFCFSTPHFCESLDNIAGLLSDLFTLISESYCLSPVLNLPATVSLWFQAELWFSQLFASVALALSFLGCFPFSELSVLRSHV